MNKVSSFNRVIDELKKLPGVGQKTAQRFAFFILKMPPGEAKAIGQAIIDIKDKSRFCSVCNNITEDDPCSICRDVKRDRSKILVVKEPSTLYTIERTGGYKGLYHVMMGALSPLDGMGPEDIKISGLLNRVEKGGIEEVILAMNPDMAGGGAALDLLRPPEAVGGHLNPIPFRISR